jgi:hypothetical protein
MPPKGDNQQLVKRSVSSSFCAKLEHGMCRRARLHPCRLAKLQEEATARNAERVRREQQRAAEAAEAKRRSDEAAAARQVVHVLGLHAMTPSVLPTM